MRAARLRRSVKHCGRGAGQDLARAAWRGPSFLGSSGAV